MLEVVINLQYIVNVLQLVPLILSDNTTNRDTCMCKA